MIEWLRFVLIVCLTALDHLAHEIVLSFNTTWDFLRHRGRWILQEKMRAMFSRRSQ
jgi:hypothetical protein